MFYTYIKLKQKLVQKVWPTCLLQNHSVKEDISFLLQWSDLVVFDYITGNLDRMVSHLHSLQWDNDAMKRPVHNLMQDKSG